MSLAAPKDTKKRMTYHLGNHATVGIPALYVHNPEDQAGWNAFHITISNKSGTSVTFKPVNTSDSNERKREDYPIRVKILDVLNEEEIKKISLPNSSDWKLETIEEGEQEYLWLLIFPKKEFVLDSENTLTIDFNDICPVTKKEGVDQGSR